MWQDSYPEEWKGFVELDGIDDIEYIGGSLVTPQKAYIKEFRYKEGEKMSHIDTMVVREGKWVSASDTEAVPGEPCIDISDGYDYYDYRLSMIPFDENSSCTIWDADIVSVKEAKFNEALEKQGLPKYFDKKKELLAMDSAKESVKKILEIADKHGYACVVGLKKGNDAFAGIIGSLDNNDYVFNKAFAEALEVCNKAHREEENG